MLTTKKQNSFHRLWNPIIALLAVFIAVFIIYSGEENNYFQDDLFKRVITGHHEKGTEQEKTNYPNQRFMQIPIISGWEFRQSDKNNWFPATVPGTVHTDLLNNKLIEDPFYRLNESDIQWIENKDWEYRTIFTVDAELLSRDMAALQFDGLDTYARVYLNDHLILESENMFVGFTVDCKSFLREGENQLRVYFDSPVRRGMERLKKLDYILPATNEQAPHDQRTNVFTRKAPFHYGWDWGPRLVTSGIWRPVSIRAWDRAIIDDVYVVTRTANKRKAELSVDVSINNHIKGDYTLALYIDGKPNGKKQELKLTAANQTISFDAEIAKPSLWWPNGLGTPHLYHLEFRLESENNLLHSYSLDYGVRTLKLVQNPDDVGHSFHFEVNGIPVFMKGANVIPSETLTPSVTADTYQKLIENAVAAHMNMLRVWGGAIYEEELFYQLCNENGILVWQDFMFACSLQPGDENHLENIRLEAEYNIKRLRNNPSLALWCGNNENLMAWHHWGWKESFEPQDREIEWQTYERIFHEILPSAVAQFDPKNSYWASSPMSTDYQLADRKSGDEHDWTIWFGEKPFASYWENVPRFVSEWGFQAFPPMATIKSFSLPQDYSFHSDVMRHRQRSRMDFIEQGFDGNDMIKRYMEQYYKVPDDFEQFVYVSQLLQAKGYKTAIEAHRSAMPHCMGSLYWQLNDSWPTISWATLDYFYRWKAAHYAVKKAFAPVITTAFADDAGVIVFVVSDKLEPSKATLQLELIDFSGNTVFSEQKRITIKANTSTLVWEKNLANHLLDGADKNLLLKISLVNKNEIIADNILYFSEPLDLALPKTDVKISIEQQSTGYQISLLSEKLAKNVYLSSADDDAFFSDNFFDLLPGTVKTIVVNSENNSLTLNDFSIIYLNQ
jgi:beta-mannosidase